jgi:aryl-alcohol dehydrogenase-like predicted oxidoreductase
MRYLDVGGVRLSVIGLGTWQFGSREWGYGADYARHEAGAIVARALDLGVNLIDTAEVYGLGQSERIVGRAIEGQRDRVFLATKIAPFVPFDPVVARRADGSLRRLGVERIDLYQAHWPNPVFSPGPLFRALGDLQKAGKVTHIGVSNYPLDRWRQAEHDLGGDVLSNQVSYSLVDRRPERDVLPWAETEQRVIIAYSPLGQGVLSGRYSADVRPGGMRHVNTLFAPENMHRAEPLLQALRRVADAHDASPSQVALAWVVRRPNVVAIPGASSVAQVEANVAAADLELTDDENEELMAASDVFSPLTGVNAFADIARAQWRQWRPPT